MDVEGGMVGVRLGRRGVAMDLSAKYLAIARKLMRESRRNQLELVA